MMSPADLTLLLRDYGNVVSFCFEVDQVTGECSLLIKLSGKGACQTRPPSIKFTGVSDFDLDRLGGGLVEVFLVVTEDGRDPQRERRRYRVKDYKWRAFSFLCDGWVLDQ